MERFADNYDSSCTAEYNSWVDYINEAVPVITAVAKDNLAHECLLVQPRHGDCVGWYIGSSEQNCYRTNLYLLPDEKIIELHHFVSNHPFPYIDLSRIDDRVLLSEKDFYDMKNILKNLVNFGLRLGVEPMMSKEILHIGYVH